MKLERDLQENFDFAFGSLNKSSAEGLPGHSRDLSLGEGGPVAPISRFSSVQTPNSVYQNKSNNSTYQSDTSAGERSSTREPLNSGLTMTESISTSSIHSTLRHQNRNSLISNMSDIEGERSLPVDSAPAPTVPLTSAHDRGRTMKSRPSVHGRMHSTASAGSGASAFSVPPQLVPERTSSIRDSDVPPFQIGDAGWE